MVNKIIIVVLAVINILLLIVCCRQYSNPRIIYIKDTVQNKIDTVYKEIDSIDRVVYITKYKIQNLEYEYKKDYSNIINKSATEDIKFFSEYLISQDDRGLFDSLDTDSIKTN